MIKSIKKNRKTKKKSIKIRRTKKNSKKTKNKRISKKNKKAGSEKDTVLKRKFISEDEDENEDQYFFIFLKDLIYSSKLKDDNNLTQLGDCDASHPDMCSVIPTDNCGITQTCDILQKIVIITYVLYNYIKYDDYILVICIKTVLRLIEQGVNSKNIFIEQEDKSFKDFLLDNISESEFKLIIKLLKEINFIRNRVLDNRNISLKPTENDNEDEWQNFIDKFWELSFQTPLSIEFFNSNYDTSQIGGIYAVVHSFIIYNGFIMSGWADEKFSVPFKIEHIEKDEFSDFLKLFGAEKFNINKEEESKQQFEHFFRKYFFDGAILKIEHETEEPLNFILQKEIENYFDNRKKYDFCVLHLKNINRNSLYKTQLLETVTTETQAFEKLIEIIGPLLETHCQNISTSSNSSSNSIINSNNISSSSYSV